MHALIFLIALLNLVTSISWYKNFGTSIDNPECTEETQPIVEYYKIDDYQYMFFSERVSWDEAQIICPIYDGQLAIVNTASKAYKLAAAIAESNIDMEDIWIGGQRSDKGNWTWVNEEPIPSEPIDGFPPWLRTPDRLWKQCVAIDRYTVDVPLFVDLDCRLPKPFICQRDFDAPANPDVTLPSHMVKTGMSTYILYHSRISWGTAAAFCRMRGYRLAIIPNNKIAKIVGSAMVRSRPSFENMWISGHFIHKKWRWLATGEAMQSYPNEDNYPPWHYNSTNLTSGCILLDRHICDNPIFLSMKCDRKRDFICEKYEKNTKHNVKPGPIKMLYKNYTLSLFLKDLNWHDAQRYCYDQNAYLTEVYDYNMMKHITTIMSDQESEPVHVWLGGMFIKDRWVWVESNKSIPVSKHEGGFMEWCDIEDKSDNACLNMDREAHDKPVVYGLKCKLKQPFICTKRTIMFTAPISITIAKPSKQPTTSKPLTRRAATKNSTTRATTKLLRSATIITSTTQATTKMSTTRPTTKSTTTATTTTSTKTTPTTTTTTTTTPTTTTPATTTHTTTPTTTTPTITTPATTTHTTTSTTTTPTTTTPTTTTPTTTTPTTTASTTITPTTTTPTITTPATTTHTTTSTTTTPTTTTPTTTTPTTTTPTTTTPTTTTPTTTTPTTTASTTITPTTTTTTTPPTTRRKFTECEQTPIATKVRQDKVYVSFFTSITFAKAEPACIEAGGKLAKVLKNQKMILSENLKQKVMDCAVEHLWIDANKLNCTYIRYSTNTALRSTDCLGEKGRICEIYCSDNIFKASIFENNIWNCSSEENEMLCSVSCKQGSVLAGANTLLCSTARWVDIYNRTTLLPICQREENVPSLLLGWITEFYEKLYRILYVVDEAITITTEQWWQQLQFIAGLIQAFPLSELFPFGMITYDKKAKVVIPFNATDTCEVLEALHKLRPDPMAELSFYKPALELAATQIKKFHRDENVVMFFFATTPNAGEEYHNVLKTLNKNLKIFTIVVSEAPTDDAMSLSSIMDDKLLSYKFNDFESFSKVTFGLANYRSKELDCPERLYTFPKDALCHQDSISIYNGGVMYTAFFNKKNYADAQIKCNDAGGKLASFKGRDLKGIVSNIMKEAKSCAAIELWITSNQAPCASIEISHKRENSEMLTCSLQLGEICEISCDFLPTLPKYANNIWNCTKIADLHTCYAECKGDSVMRGSDTVTCTNKGWVVNSNKKITFFPVCFDENNVIKRLMTVINDLKQETDGFLFLVDISGLASNRNWKPLEFVISMIHVFPISSQYPLGLIVFHKTAEVLIPYRATNSCKVLKQIEKLKLPTPSNNDGYSAYNTVLKKAQDQILNLQHRRRTIIFFVTDRNNKGEPYTDTTIELQKRHMIFAVGINKKSLKHLDSLASMYNDKLLMYKFNHYNSYNAVWKKMQDENSKLKC